jgi:hypothetical protein
MSRSLCPSRLAALVCAALACAAAPAARAADDAVAADLKCMVVAAALAQNADPSLKNAGAMAGVYYLGRLDGRAPNLDLEARLRATISQMTPQELVPQIQRCGQEVQARVKSAGQIGSRMPPLGGGGTR